MNIKKINNWFGKRADDIIKHRWFIIVTSIVLVGIASMGLSQVEIESSWDGYFLEGDPVLVKTDEFKEIFGNDEFVAVLTECDNTFSKESLELIRELSNELMDSLSYAEKITSLTDIEFMTGTENGMQIEQIVPSVIPSDPILLDSIRKKVFSKPNIAKRLVSKDGRLSWILLKLRTFPTDSIWKQTSNIGPDMLTGEQTEHIISKAKYKDIAPRATGMPYLSTMKQHFFTKEMGRVMGMALLLAILVLIMATKSFRGVIFPILTSIGAVVMLYGTAGHIGYKIDSSMTSIPVVLSFAIAIAYNIHFFSFFKKRFYFHGKRKRAVKETITELGWPILFSALTTMAALLTFLVIPMKPLRFVGIGTASCVLFTLVMVLILMPSLLSFGKDRKPYLDTGRTKDPWLDRQMSTLGNFVLAHSKTIIILAILISTFLVIGMTKVESAFDIEKTMGRKVPYVNNLLEICKTELGSLYSYDVLIEFDNNGDAKKPENLKKLEQASTYVESLQLTKRTTSVLDILKDLNQTINENKKSFYTIPNNENQIAQMLLLYENAGGTESEYWIDYDYKRLRLMVELKSYNSGEAERELAAVTTEIQKLYPNASITTVGSIPQFTTMMQYVVKGQLQSFVLALIIIALLLMIVFGSVRVGLIGLIPNIAPALAVGGVMGWLGIPLDMMTATIIPMILGLAVDDTIHFINHGHLEFSKTPNYKLAINKSFRVVGVALVLSTVTISANFLVYTTSVALSFANLGMLAIVGMISALLADLFITPILLQWFHIFGKEKIDFVKDNTNKQH